MISTVILCAVFLFGNHANLRRPTQSIHRTLSVTVHGDLDYTGIFDDLMQAYSTAHELVRVKATNMGSMFRLTYRITLREARLEKSLIEFNRCRRDNPPTADSEYRVVLHTFYLCFTSTWLRLTGIYDTIILQKSDIAFDTGDPTL